MKSFIVFIFGLLIATNLFGKETLDLPAIKSRIQESLSKIQTISINLKDINISYGLENKSETLSNSINYDFKRNLSGPNDYLIRINENDSQIGYSLFTSNFRSFINNYDRKINFVKGENMIIGDEILTLINDLDVDKYFSIYDKYHSLENVNFSLDSSVIEECEYNNIPCYKVKFTVTYSGRLRTNTDFLNVQIEYIFDNKSFLPYEYYAKFTKFNNNHEDEELYLTRKMNYQYSNINGDFPKDYFDYKHLLDLGYVLNKE